MTETAAHDPAALGLPHREPFIFVDRVTALEPGVSCCGLKTFPATEPFFRGHFPGHPVVPGVIITEALAQTAGLAAGQPGRSFRLTAIKGMKFLSAVCPGEEIHLTAKKMASVGGLWQFEVAAEVRAQKVAEGIIVLSETPAL